MKKRTLTQHKLFVHYFEYRPHTTKIKTTLNYNSLHKNYNDMIDHKFHFKRDYVIQIQSLKHHQQKS